MDRRTIEYYQLLLLVAFILVALAAQAQPTAFGYQGRLSSNGAAVSGLYDFGFKVFDAAEAGTVVGGPLTLANTAVSNGVFIVTLDFGPGVFTGPNRWLEIGVRTNREALFTILSPRQALNSVPYAIHSGSVNGAGVIGQIPASGIPGGSVTSSMLAPGAVAGNLAASGQSAVPSGGVLLSNDPDATNLTAAGYTRIGAQLDLCWQQRRSEVARISPSAVWTGNKLLVWGGTVDNPTPLRSGGCFDPAANSWSSLNTGNSPSARTSETVVWTGDKMIVWGGVLSSTFYDDGALYEPSSDIWSAMSTTNAPERRASHTAVWTGKEMIVWGGRTSTGFGAGVWDVNTGALYDPASDTWKTVSTNGAPSPRFGHTAVWTGTAMLIWGGAFEDRSALRLLADGARYDPLTDQWSPMATNGAPTARFMHTAVWTGREMIVWGGQVGAGFLTTNDGCIYNPETDAWTAVSLPGAPGPRMRHVALWTGTDMLVWGGEATSGEFDTGGLYDPRVHAWRSVTTTGAPAARAGHVGVWTGNELLIFGGYGGERVFGDVYSYTPSRTMYLYLRP